VATKAEAGAGPVVDCDLHPHVASVDDLYPYMTAGWREFYRTSPFYAMSDREPAPAGQPADDPAEFARCFLDAEGVSAGVLVSIQAGTVNGLMDHVRAAAFVRSLNDYLVERWLAADPRFRLAAAVSPLDPAQAAREIRRMARLDGVAHPRQHIGDGITRHNVPFASVPLTNWPWSRRELRRSGRAGGNTSGTTRTSGGRPAGGRSACSGCGGGP